MRKVITGEQVAQIYNPDPFARPVWRAPVYQTPAGIILLAWLVRAIVRFVRLIVRHPVAAGLLALLAVLWLNLGWPGMTAIAGCAVLVLVIWRCCWPTVFGQVVGTPARCAWRAWCYRRRWHAVISIADLAPWYRGRIVVPVLVRVTSTRYVDRVQVRLVSGQSPAEFADRADNLAHGFRALLYRVRSARSGAVVLEFVRCDALAAVIPVLPVPERVDLRALPVGRREDGLPWLVRLHGTHLLIAGATGAGKASLLWGLVRAMLPLIREGLVRVLAADPKLMELAYGRVIFDAYGAYAADPASIVAMLEAAVADMQARSGPRPTGRSPKSAAAAGRSPGRPTRGPPIRQEVSGDRFHVHGQDHACAAAGHAAGP
jgi:S-DNA-T family DNA segregation ATPase FtsK/SpoIIIE